jgi:hypothetical protein
VILRGVFLQRSSSFTVLWTASKSARVGTFDGVAVGLTHQKCLVEHGRIEGVTPIRTVEQYIFRCELAQRESA